jgi:N-acetylglucosaminyldiphosphoundecaprenol N-acetyl-beta-D-mannosaminyltransferase
MDIEANKLHEMTINEDANCWPKKLSLFGIRISATTYEESAKMILDAAENRISAIVDHMPVHGLMEADRNAAFRAMINRFDIVAPDGQPVRWVLNWLYKAGLADRVYGPELMMHLCRGASRRGIKIYLYGSTPEVVGNLRHNLIKKYSALSIAGWESPPYRNLLPEEDVAVVDRINDSGAGIIFVGLGCPKQEIFAFEHRDRFKAVQVCVGAAFDFHAGNKKMAPGWMQRNSLEWLFRLLQEPKRLWRRYLYTNIKFVRKVFPHLLNRPICRENPIHRNN